SPWSGGGHPPSSTPWASTGAPWASRTSSRAPSCARATTPAARRRRPLRRAHNRSTASAPPERPAQAADPTRQTPAAAALDEGQTRRQLLHGRGDRLDQRRLTARHFEQDVILILEAAPGDERADQEVPSPMREHIPRRVKRRVVP